MGGLRWKTNVLMSAFLVPGIVFVIFFILNLFLWGANSSAAIPFTTLLALLCLWFGISLPLTFIGSFLGFRRVVSPLETRLTSLRYPFVSSLLSLPPPSLPILLSRLIRSRVRYLYRTGCLIHCLAH